MVGWLRGARSRRRLCSWRDRSAGSLGAALAGIMREPREPPEPEPPLPPPSPRPPSRLLRRTLHSLRSPFRAGSPFHLGSLARSPSAKSSASDGDLARDERTMRKRNKKNRDQQPASDASRSTDSSPSVDTKKKEGFMRRMGSIGKKRAEGAAITPPLQPGTKESTLDSPTPPLESLDSVSSTTPETASPRPPTPDAATASDDATTPAPSASASTSELPKPALEAARPTPEPVSPIAVEHPVATRPFTKAAWKRQSEPSMERPVEDPSPESALRRRIAFVAQASACFSEDHDDAGAGAGVGGRGARGEVGSLEEAVALARVRLGAAAAPGAAHERGNDTEEEGYADAMPAYGDLIEPVDKPGDEPVSAEECRPRAALAPLGTSLSGERHSGRCARAMSKYDLRGSG